jgi:hypothetical protein
VAQGKRLPAATPAAQAGLRVALGFPINQPKATTAERAEAAAVRRHLGPAVTRTP